MYIFIYQVYSLRLNRILTLIVLGFVEFGPPGARKKLTRSIWGVLEHCGIFYPPILLVSFFFLRLNYTMFFAKFNGIY